MTIAPVSTQALAYSAPPPPPSAAPPSSAKSQPAQDTVHLSSQAMAASGGDSDGDGH